MTMNEQETMSRQSLPTVDEVFAWMRKLYDESYSGLTKTEKNEQHMYGTMVTTPSDKKFCACWMRPVRCVTPRSWPSV